MLWPIKHQVQGRDFRKAARLYRYLEKESALQRLRQIGIRLATVTASIQVACICSVLPLRPVKAHSQRCAPKPLVITGAKQTGPTCLAATAVSVLSHWEKAPPSVRELARILPVYRDGVHWFDLALALEARGVTTRLFTGPPEAVGRLVASGFPIIALTARGADAHAVVVHGITRHPTSRGCGAVDTLLVMDPRNGRSKWVAATSFAATQSEERLMLIYPKHMAQRLQDSGIPVAVVEKVDRRIRAQTLLQRAQNHLKPNRQKLQLLKRAAEYDPCWMPVHSACTQTAHALKLSSKTHCHIHSAHCAHQHTHSRGHTQ